jgi:hypothetical protein
MRIMSRMAIAAWCIGVSAWPGLGAAQQVPPPIAGLGYVLSFDEAWARNDICDGPTSQNNGCDVPKSPHTKPPYVWFNGVDQCCMTPQKTVRGQILYGVGSMYPTVPPGRTAPYYPYQVAPGNLQIAAKKFHALPGENGQNWASGILTSVDEYGSGASFEYGYMQIAAQLPSTMAQDGDGSWSAFWLLNTALLTGGNGTDGEIDVFENYGQFASAFCTTLHDWSGGTTPFQACQGTYPGGANYPNLTTGTHIYGMWWTASTMRFYLDNIFLYSTPTPPVMQGQPYFLLIDNGIGGGWNSNLTPSPSTMSIQSVEVWQLPAPRK